MEPDHRRGECTNCNLCTLAAMDEYVDNDWPGYSAPMPRHGHKWINILQKERGQTPMIDIAYVPTLCNHCGRRTLHQGGAERRDQEAQGRHRHHRSGQGQGAEATGRRLPLRPHLVERGAGPSAALDLRRPPDRPGLAADPRPAVLPDRRHACRPGRGRGDGKARARRRPRSDQA